MALLQNVKCISLPTLRKWKCCKGSCEMASFFFIFFYWWAFAESKYWCNHCYFERWHTTNLQFILLFTTLFIQPVQIEPQPTPPPLFLPLSFSHNPTSSLKFCIPTWSMRNDLAGFRQALYPRLFTQTERDRARERHRHECHTDRNNPCDKHKWMHTHFLSLSHATMHRHIQSHNESIWMNPNWTLCESSNHSS